jgi:hypothetical protein
MGAAELFLLGSNLLITVLSGLVVVAKVSTLRIGGEEGCVLLRGHIEVLIDLSTLSKFQFQHLLFRSIPDAGDAAGIYGNSLHAFLDANEPRKDRGWQLLLSSPGAIGPSIRSVSSTLSVRSMFCSGAECRHQHRDVSSPWCRMTYCNTSIHWAPKDLENSSHAHKQDIGAATRRPPKGTGLPPS